MITKKSKVGVIAEAFWNSVRGVGNSFLPKEVLEERRRICFECPFNSKNVPSENLSTFDKVRDRLTKPFCTICECYVKEKTNSPTEECAYAEKGNPPKWNRVAVMTTEKSNLDIINLTPNTINIDADVLDYIIVMDNFTQTTSFQLEIIAKFELEASMQLVKACPCLDINLERKEHNKVILSGTLNYDKVPSNKFQRTFSIRLHDINNEPILASFMVVGDKH